MQTPHVPYQTPYTQQTPFTPTPQYAPTDQTMVILAIVGLGLTATSCLPVGLFTGPMALARAARAEERVAQGLHPRSHMSDINHARIFAWVGIALSLPVVLAVAGFIVLIVLGPMSA